MLNSVAKLVRWLKVVTLGCLLALLLAGLYFWWWPSHSLESERAPFRLSEAATKAELAGVIGSQLDAFRQGDFAGAYGFAGAGLQAQMDAATFEEMVRANFPGMTHSRSASYGVTFDNGENAAVNVGILTQSGRTLHYQYLLHREPAGWKIIGVTRVQPPGATV
jgi:hypothetical protein